MKNFFTHTKNPTNALFVFTVALVSIFFGNSSVAEAQFFESLLGSVPVQVIGGPGTQAENRLVQLLQDIHQKEFQQDPSVYQNSQKAIQKQAEEVMNSLATGNDGGPKWIVNPEAYKRGIEEDVAGEFIYEDVENSQMCEDFKDKVQEALVELEAEQSKSTSERFSCPLAEEINELEAFQEGGFEVGGYGGFLKMISEPDKNTPVGQFIDAKNELLAQQNEAVENAILEANWGRGYLPDKDCTAEEIKAGVRDNCITVTPGANNQEASAFVQTLPYQYPPDEYGEDQSDLWTDLMNQILSGVDGFLGLATNGSYGSDGNLTYFDALQEERREDLLEDDFLQTALDNTVILLEYQLDLTSQIDEVDELYKEASSTYAGDSCWDLDFSRDLRDERKKTLEKIPLTIATVLALETLLEEYEEAVESDSSVSQIINDFGDLIDEGLVGTESVLQEIEILLFEEVEPAIEDFEDEIEDAGDECN